jgi:NAD(P)-dependent dehydrogenase (short-subunit alcohol dehydrogenase family)
MDLAGSTVLVTGASSGIGRETAVVLGELNARVVLTGRDQGRLEETFGRLSGEGHRIEPFDLARVEEIPNWLRSLARRNGPLRGLVHCAGVQLTSPIRFVTQRNSEDLLRTNLQSAIMLMRGFSNKDCHAAESSAVCVAPGYVATEMLAQLRELLSPEEFEALERAHPLGFGAARDVANAAAFLLADTGRWITGSTLVVDGGYSAQ